MRKLWDEWKENLQNLNKPLLQFTFKYPSNSYNVYMDYMYKTYPPGFGENLKMRTLIQKKAKLSMDVKFSMN